MTGMHRWQHNATDRRSLWNVAWKMHDVNVRKTIVLLLTLLKRSPIGRMKRSNLAGFRVNDSPTKVTFVTILFQPFLRVLPVLTTLNASASLTALTLGNGTWYLPWKKRRIKCAQSTRPICFSLCDHLSVLYFVKRISMTNMKYGYGWVINLSTSVNHLPPPLFHPNIKYYIAAECVSFRSSDLFSALVPS